MRQFFFNLLENLDKLAGLQQYQKLCAMKDAKEQINSLLNALENVCGLFPYIPDLDKQRIVNEAVIADNEFISLNARIVYKWFNAKKDGYFTELAHQDSKTEAEPLTGPQRDEWIERFKKALENAPLVQTHTTGGSFAAVRETRKPDKTYTPPTFDEVMKKELHIQWIRENFDARGEKKPGFVEEKEWLKLNS